MKRYTKDWKKILPNHVSTKRFISRIYKELSKHIIKNTIFQTGSRSEQTLYQQISMDK